MIEKNNLVLGCIAFVSLSTIYVLFGFPTFQKKANYLVNNGKRNKKAIQIKGLENTENSCYLNVIVQSLSSSQSFINWLKESVIQQQLLPPNLLADPQQQSAIRFIHYLFSIIFRNNLLYKAITSSSLDSHYFRQDTKFCIDKTLTFQLLKLLQGLHELFNFICSSLETEILRTVRTKDSLNEIQSNDILNDLQNSDQKINGNNLNCDGIKAKNLNLEGREKIRDLKNNGDSNNLRFTKDKDARLDQLNVKKGLINFSKEFTNEYNRIKKSLNLKRNLPTKGLLAHQMCCLKCDYKFTIKFESFNSISLALPNALQRLNQPIKLKDCLNQFVSNEILRDVVCENCEKLDKEQEKEDNKKDSKELNEQRNLEKKKSTFIKRLTFAKLPNLLVIHFQRLIFTPSGLIKKEDRIQFPHILIMDDYEHYAIQQKSDLNVLSEFKNAKLLGTDLENKQKENKEQKDEIFDESPVKSNVIIGSDLDKEKNNENQLSQNKDENRLNQNKDENQPNHLNHTELSSNNKDTLKIKYPIADFSVSSQNSSYLKTEEEQQKKIISSTSLKITENKKNLDKTLNSVKNSSIISPSTSPSFSVDTTNNKAFLENLKEARETNAYSTIEEKLQSTKMSLSFNSIKSNSNLTSLLKQKNAKYQYKLNACIAHFGNSFSGHYVNHRRLPNASSNSTDHWYFTNDRIVRHSNLEEALSSNAYMLFYERILNN